MGNDKKRILITSALAYVNGIPHLGHMVGCFLPADIFARFKRLLGYEVLYIGGTDEHGTPSEVGALKEGMDTESYVDKYRAIHKDIYKKFNLSFDYIGRTSSKYNHHLTQYFAMRLKENGFLEERDIKQVYSIDDKRFLPDRYVTGTCPYCGYDKARGDQCENCTKLLDPTDLIDPKSTLSGSSNLEVRETRHLFLKLDKLQDKVEKWVNRQKWNKLTKSIAKKWLTEGLRERCITRDLNWGVEVKNPPFDPVSGDMLENADKTWPGFEDKVFYVWFDAPIGYISITWEWAKKTGNDWKKWWYDNEDDVEYYEFMGKDNIPFHSVFFPAMLIGTGENWTKVDQLKGSSWLTYEGGKFSKSEKRGIFCDEATSIYPADYWRYWLIANYPETDDVDFTMEKFKEVINKDLNDVLGNFVMRVAKFAKSKFDGKVPYEAQDSAVENEMKRELFRRISVYKKYFENLEFRKAMSELRAIWALGNEYINKAEPWVLMKESKEKAGNVINNGCQLIYIFAVLALPIIPEAAEKILNIFNINSKEALWIENEANYRKIKAGTEITIPDAIFTKI